MKPPSGKQIGYLNGLGYQGPAPESSEEASHLISQLKSGRTSKQASRSVKTVRKKQAKRAKQNLDITKEYLADLDRMTRDGDGVIKVAGFRLKAIKGETAQTNEIYHKAFLPLETAKQFPELLMLDLDSDELARRPKKGNIVVRPGVVHDIENMPKSGCLGVLVLLATIAECLRGLATATLAG